MGLQTTVYMTRKNHAKSGFRAAVPTNGTSSKRRGSPNPQKPKNSIGQYWENQQNCASVKTTVNPTDFVLLPTIAYMSR